MANGNVLFVNQRGQDCFNLKFKRKSRVPVPSYVSSGQAGWNEAVTILGHIINIILGLFLKRMSHILASLHF